MRTCRHRLAEAGMSGQSNAHGLALFQLLCVKRLLLLCTPGAAATMCSTSAALQRSLRHDEAGGRAARRQLA